MKIYHKSQIAKAITDYTEAIKYSDPSSYLYGYSNFRLAILYDTNSLSDKIQIIDRYKKANNVFYKFKDYKKSARCCYNIGRNYEYINTDSLEFYLNEAYKIGFKGNENIIIGESLCGLSSYYYNKSKFSEALHFAHKAVSFNSYMEDNTPMLSLINAYIGLGKTDSALILYDKIKYENLREDYNLFTKQNLAESTKNYKESYLILGDRFNKLDSMLSGENQRILLRAEISDRLNELETINQQRGEKLLYFYIYILIAIVAIMILIYIILLKRKSEMVMTNLIDQLRQDNIILTDEKTGLLGQASNLGNQNNLLKKDAENSLYSFFLLSESISNVKDFDRLKSNLHRTIKEIANDDFFEAVERYANKKYNNIIKDLRSRNILNPTELRLVTLSYCGCSAFMISILLGIKNYRYVYNLKYSISQKLNIDSLEKYLYDHINNINSR